jgi:hypothetical protein
MLMRGDGKTLCSSFLLSRYCNRGDGKIQAYVNSRVQVSSKTLGDDSDVPKELRLQSWFVLCHQLVGSWFSPCTTDGCGVDAMRVALMCMHYCFVGMPGG